MTALAKGACSSAQAKLVPRGPGRACLFRLVSWYMGSEALSLLSQEALDFVPVCLTGGTSQPLS